MPKRDDAGARGPLPARIARLIRRVRLLALDFDGVLTDNTVLVCEDGTEAVRCWRGDGLGLRRVEALGVKTVVISTEPNPVVALRCAKLAVPCVHGCADKRSALESFAGEHGIAAGEVAYVGNDVNDRECLKWAGLPIVVADAHPEVRRLATWRTKTPGGFGAVREICDRFHQLRGKAE